MDFNRIWESVHPDIMNFLVRRGAVRKVILKKGREKLYRSLVVLNEDNRPPRIQESRFLLLENLLRAVDRAFSQGNIAPSVSRAVVRNFIGSTILREKKRTGDFVKEHGFPPPRLLTISPTKKCNLACKGCYAASSAGNRETLSFEVFDRIIREKKEKWGSHFTVISGGEPLMYLDGGKTLFNVLEENSDTYFMMYTNGTLISKDIARRMAEVGNITPAISVEGFEKETDDRRGKGVFRKIGRAMDNLRNAGVPFGVSVTATRHNAELVLSDEFLEHYFQREGAIYGWIFQYMPIGRSFTLDLMITPEQRLAMFKKEQRVIKDMNLFLVDFWNGGPYSHGCISAGRSGGYFYIDWNGNISPCTFFPYYVSNIHEVYRENRTLNDVLLSPFFTSIRNWQNAYGYARPPHEVNNLVTPCLIRDHYDDAYGIIRRFKAKPMDMNAENALNDPDYRRRMADYGKDVRELTEKWWESEFMDRTHFPRSLQVVRGGNRVSERKHSAQSRNVPTP